MSPTVKRVISNGLIHCTQILFGKQRKWWSRNTSAGVCSRLGRATAEAVCHRPLTEDAQVHLSPITVRLWRTSGPPICLPILQLIVQTMTYPLNYLPGWYNRPIIIIIIIIIISSSSRSSSSSSSSMALQPFTGPWSFFIFLILYTEGRIPWMGDQPVARPLPTHKTTQTQNKRTQYRHPSIQKDSNPTISVFERAKTVHASERAATVIGPTDPFEAKILG
jgi:hypothetical protein